MSLGEHEAVLTEVTKRLDASTQARSAASLLPRAMPHGRSSLISSRPARFGWHGAV